MNPVTANPTELLRWWHHYQAEQLNQEADRIRNGLLQEVVALRRQVELTCPGHNADCDAHLSSLSQLYTSLEQLSDRLGSPYLHDSLPLAIQHALVPWQAQLRLHLPPTWPPEPMEITRLVIALVQHLLGDPLANRRPNGALPPAQLSLQQQQQQRQLTLEFPATVPPGPHLSPLLATFELISGGEYAQNVTASTQRWVLHWTALV